MTQNKRVTRFKLAYRWNFVVSGLINWTTVKLLLLSVYNMTILVTSFKTVQPVHTAKTRIMLLAHVK